MTEFTDKRTHAVHIPREHQSAPAPTEADKAVALAADEIRDGKWMPSSEALGEIDALPSTALRAGNKEALEAKLTLEDFERTDESMILAEHPAVKEALAKLEQEKQASKSGQEYIEKAAMIHEMLEYRNRGQRWEGQERWQGKDNEEMRFGKILTPLQFYEQLMKVGLGVEGPLTETRDFRVSQSEWTDDIEVRNGKPCLVRKLVKQKFRVRTIGRGEKLIIGRDVKKVHPWDKSGRVALMTLENVNMAGLIANRNMEAVREKDEPVQVAVLQWPFGTEWMVYRFDEFGVPRTAKYLGWRTALLTLIRTGIVTEQQAHKAFPLGTGPAAAWYRQQLFEWSNGGGRVQ